MNKNTTAAQPLDLDKLEALAQVPMRATTVIKAEQGLADFHDAANPATILALIAQARAAQPTDDVKAAAWAVVQDAIDSRRAEVHPCDRENNDLAVRACSSEIQVLHAALKAVEQSAGAADTTVSASERAQFEAWMKSCPGHPFAGAFANLMWDAWQARATLAPVAAQQAAAIPADWCKDCIGQGIDTDPPEPGADDTCRTCNGTGAAKAPAAQADYTVDDSELARKIMVFMGRATTASMEPGADPLRDRLAERLALWRPASPASTPEASQQAAAVAAPSDDDKYAVIVDRRDLFDFLRAAWRAGQDFFGPMTEQERWERATNYADAEIKGWSTMRASTTSEDARDAAPVISSYDIEKVKALKFKFVDALIHGGIQYRTCGAISAALNRIIDDSEAAAMRATQQEGDK